MGKDFTSTRGDDNVFTPYSMTEQLLENEKFDNTKKTLEPSCGKKLAIVKILKKNEFNDVMFGDINLEQCNQDFLTAKFSVYQKIDYIITNPPYSKLDDFIIKSKKVATEKFAFLCKLTHLGGVERFTTGIFKDENYPLTKIYLFTRQANLRFTNDEQEKKGYMKYRELREDKCYPAGMYYYNWMIFEKNNGQIKLDEIPQLKWINNNKYILRKNVDRIG